MAETDDDEEPKENQVFRPVIEEVSGHKVKKCSIFIRRLGYIEEAVKRGSKSIDMTTNWKVFLQ